MSRETIINVVAFFAVFGFVVAGLVALYTLSALAAWAWSDDSSTVPVYMEDGYQ